MLDPLHSHILFTQEHLAARLERASAMLHTPDQPRKAAEHIDTLLADTAKHLGAVDAVLLPAVRHRLPDGARLVHDYLHAARELELALAHVKAREYGSAYDAGRSWKAVWADVGAAMAHQHEAERGLADALAPTMEAPNLTALADQLHAAAVAAPSRPHPYAPHTGLPGSVARRVLHLVDSFWDTTEGRMVPEPVRPPHGPPGRLTQYLLADPRFDEE